MVLACFLLLGRQPHLQFSLTSLFPEEWEAFPGLISDTVQQDADRSRDWHCDPHCLACHTLDRAPVAHQRYIPLLVVQHYTVPPNYGNEHIPDWYFGD